MNVEPQDATQQLAARTAARFAERFGREPRWIAAAPGRVNLIGEHIDYSDGFVLPMAIDRYCMIAADTRADGAQDDGATCSISSGINNSEATISLTAPRPHASKGHWSNYVAGVIAGFAARGTPLRPFDAVVETTVPVGGGLSSSASLEVATATLLEAVTGRVLDARDKALLCQQAEHEFAGVPCGIMDQFASVMGRADHLMLLDCRSQQVEHIPFTAGGVTVLIVNTNVKHELSGGEYAERREQCESAARKLGVSSLRDALFPQLKARRSQLSDVEYRRALHAVGEMARTVRAAAGVRAGDWSEVGRLMYASHDSLRDSYEVSCRELDLLVNIAKDIGPQGGVFGSRMTGGGFGGCTVTLVDTSRVGEVSAQLLEKYHDASGIEASALVSRPAQGAHLVHTN